MDAHDSALISARRRLMSIRRVVCTGNPEKTGTLAHGFKKIFPDADFLCRSTGWNLQALDSVQIQKLKDIFASCNTFLNCSYIAPGVQSALLDVCHSAAKHCDVVNIGSTHEYDGLGDPDYQSAKRNLRDKSLAYNSFRFRTYHFILGGIKNDHESRKQDWLEVRTICQEVVRTLTLPYHVPITSLDHIKKPW